MLEALRLSDLLKPLMATLNGVDTHFDSVSIDARTVERGGLFVALAGSRSNGHDFVAQARENGAAAAMVRLLTTQGFGGAKKHTEIVTGVSWSGANELVSVGAVLRLV